MTTDLDTLPTARAVAFEGRRLIIRRRNALADSGLDDVGTRGIIRALHNVVICSQGERAIHAMVPDLPHVRPYADQVLDTGLEVDLRALGFPADVAANAEISVIDDTTHALTW